ncbi:FAD-binding domain-containing protein [Annulohypoxylon truncatum]|uniref:FAD-binding domain-containing protein n=1 Tax=Annulohypoxylon truncatum TaxID=327061 RepID=UPI002008EA6D|nr:FAD-binding domain-containing protein [Annulohypoxylon truncatum]KAI1208962.1 FAD-binding domain-containing protein [Annulohypoxylon truncatum]
MPASIRNAVLTALSVIPTARSVAHIPVRGGDTTLPVLRSQQDTCNQLKQALTGVNGTLFPSDGATYEDFEEENYSAACRLPAACIVNPKSAQEVSTVIKILSQTGTKFAVRSGGHNYIPGFASINETGVLVSLSNLNTTVLSTDKKTAKIGPGNRWEEVYGALVPQGVTVVGGRVGPVGVGGLMLGGGLSYFATQRGLAFDNVKSYEVVLANGSIVNASANNQYSDLYKGLRGGGPNFGIVTNYELYTFPVGNFSVDARAYNTNQTDDFLRAIAEYQQEGQLDPLSSVSIQVLETGPTIMLLYNEPVQSAKAFDAFYNLGSYTSIAAFNGSLIDVLALTGSRFSTGNVSTYGETFTHKVNADLNVDLYNIFVEETANLPSGASGAWVPNPIAASVATVGKQYGGNLIGLQEVPQQWYEWFITWTDLTQEQAIWNISQRITQRCTAATAAKNASLPYLFTNTAGMEQNVLGSFGSKNVNTIKAIAAKYDPGQIFQKLQNDGFLIRKL